MRILVDILHPAHVHFFRHIYQKMKQKHDIQFVARNKDVTLNLLDSFKIQYTLVSDAANSTLQLAAELLKRAVAIDKYVRKEDIDCLVGISGISIAPIGRLRKRPVFVFTDTEDSGLASSIVFPLATRVITPHCFARDLGPKHVRYNGYQELAYLHPKYFTPNPYSLERDGIDLNEPFFFLRFTSFAASHDIAQHGLSLDDKLKLVDFLSKRARVVISSEGKLPRSLEKWRFLGAPADVHNYLYYSHLFFGDSQTMTTEAGLLGTPAIRCNSLVGTMHGLGNFRELEKDYGLVFSFHSSNRAFLKLKELLSVSELNQKWGEMRKQLLVDKDDVVEFAAAYIESNASRFASRRA